MDRLGRSIYQLGMLILASTLTWKAVDTGNAVFYGLAVFTGLGWLQAMLNNALKDSVINVREVIRVGERRGW